MTLLPTRERRKRERALKQRNRRLERALVDYMRSGPFYVGLGLGNKWVADFLQGDEIVNVAGYARQPVRFDKVRKVDGVRVITNVAEVVFEGVATKDADLWFVTDVPLIRRDEYHTQNIPSPALAAGRIYATGDSLPSADRLFFPKGGLAVEV